MQMFRSNALNQAHFILVYFLKGSYMNAQLRLSNIQTCAGSVCVNSCCCRWGFVMLGCMDDPVASAGRQVRGLRAQGEGQDLPAVNGHALRKRAELPVLRSAHERAVVQGVLGPCANHPKVQLGVEVCLVFIVACECSVQYR